MRHIMKPVIDSSMCAFIKRILAFCLAGIFLATPARAQRADTSGKKDRMEVDLPDETEETSIIDPGQWQIETAVLHNRYSEGPSTTLGQMLLRYGVSARLELRALLEDGRRRDRYVEETVQSTYPLAASAKYLVIQDVKNLPDVTLVGYLRLPFTNRNREQAPYWSPIVLAAFQHQWGRDHWKLEYNAGGQQAAYSREWSCLANASLHYQSDIPVEIFAEYYAQFQPGEDPLHNVGGGLAWQLGQQFEVYASAGTSVDTDHGNHFFSAGIAYRR